MSIEYPPGGTPRIHEVDDFEEAAGHHLVVIRVNCPHKARASTLLQAPLPSRLCPLSLTLARTLKYMVIPRTFMFRPSTTL